MVKVSNNILNAKIENKYKDCILKLSMIGEKKPTLLSPITGIKQEVYEELLNFQIKLFSTKAKSMVLEDLESGVVFKIIYLSTFKHKILKLLKNEAFRVYSVSKYLREKDIKVAKVLGYGNLLKNPFYVIPKMKGESFQEILNRERGNSLKLFYKIINEIIKIHKEGYFIGDANIKHFFFLGEKLEGIVDIDGIRRVVFCKLNKFSKDIGYLLRPELNLREQEKIEIINYYTDKMKIKDSNFLYKVEGYRLKRWRI